MAIVVGVFGSLIGSFLNVVVYRVPLGRSIAYPPSACTACGGRIRAFDNVPVLSWLLLRGRCRDCGVPISARYPLVELGTAVLFGVVLLRFLTAPATGSAASVVASVLQLIAFLFLAGVSVALALIDIDVHRLPNALVLPIVPIGAILLGITSLASDDVGQLLRAVLAAAASLLLYFALALVRPGGMGMGDVKLSAGLGLFVGWLGWPTLLVGTFAAFLLGGVFGALLLLSRRATRTSAIPFGPFMLLGAWIGIFFGPAVWSGYLNLVGLG